jgi:hypothetical protein
MIADARFHRRRNTQGLMDANEKMKRSPISRLQRLKSANTHARLSLDALDRSLRAAKVARLAIRAAIRDVERLIKFRSGGD